MRAIFGLSSIYGYFPVGPVRGTRALTLFQRNDVATSLEGLWAGLRELERARKRVLVTRLSSIPTVGQQPCSPLHEISLAGGSPLNATKQCGLVRQGRIVEPHSVETALSH